MHKIINSKKSIISLNGSIKKRLLNLLKKDIPIIAADGAHNKLKKLNISPTYTVGDGDSYKTPDYIYPSQDHTDFEKSISFAQKHSLLPSLVIGISGGEIDHILGNIQTLLKHGKNQSLFFLDTYGKTGLKLGIPIIDDKILINIKKGSLISIFSPEKSLITTKGLKWELEKKHLQINGILPIRNISVSDKIEVSIKGKIVLIIDITNSLPPKKPSLKTYKRSQKYT